MTLPMWWLHTSPAPLVLGLCCACCPLCLWRKEALRPSAVCNRPGLLRTGPAAPAVWAGEPAGKRSKERRPQDQLGTHHLLCETVSGEPATPQWVWMAGSDGQGMQRGGWSRWSCSKGRHLGSPLPAFVLLSEQLSSPHPAPPTGRPEH